MADVLIQQLKVHPSFAPLELWPAMATAGSLDIHLSALTMQLTSQLFEPLITSAAAMVVHVQDGGADKAAALQWQGLSETGQDETLDASLVTCLTFLAGMERPQQKSADCD